MIPASTVYTLRRRILAKESVVVWALQSGLNQTGYGMLAQDGVFGKQTQAAVRGFQQDKGLYVDGVFGPKSSAALARVCERQAEEGGYATPGGLLQGFTEGESGSILGAVNWSVDGGVDCGYTQRRVYESYYEDKEIVRSAFDPVYQMSLGAKELRTKHNLFYGRPGAPSHEAAWRLAALNHNYPVAASQIALHGVSGLSSYYTAPQAWVQNIGAKWPDGTPVETPLGWCRYYALGTSTWPGLVTKSVVSWTA